jgi:cytochrome c
MRSYRVLVLAALAVVAGAVAAVGVEADDPMIVQLCDGQTTTTVDAKAPKTKENGQKIADELMAQWQRAHPDANWIATEREKHTIVEPADNKDVIGRMQGQTYGQVTERDVLTWQRETLAMAVHGSTIFHSGDELGSTIAVSCDMCHPDAANTHAETYPKFQPQLGRVALLRDMINWCIEHPVRGQKLEPDSAKMRALEAYIMAQRKGATMNYGAR